MFIYKPKTKDLMGLSSSWSWYMFCYRQLEKSAFPRKISHRVIWLLNKQPGFLLWFHERICSVCRHFPLCRQRERTVYTIYVYQVLLTPPLMPESEPSAALVLALNAISHMHVQTGEQVKSSSRLQPFINGVDRGVMTTSVNKTLITSRKKQLSLFLLCDVNV